MAEPGADVIVPLPTSGRCFSAERPVRFGDAAPSGRLRLDAIATYIQDVAADDTRDALGDTDSVWVVRRTLIEVVRPPRYGELLRLRTWCGGLGSRWAERRVQLDGDRGGLVQTASIWVHLHRGAGRPAVLTDTFVDAYAAAANGREVSARLRHAAPPLDGSVQVRRAPWQVRAADLDGLGHVNNAATWQFVEDWLDEAEVSGPFRAEVEHREELRREPVTGVALGSPGEPDGLSLWLVRDVDGVVSSSARIRRSGR